METDGDKATAIGCPSETVSAELIIHVDLLMASVVGVYPFGRSIPGVRGGG